MEINLLSVVLFLVALGSIWFAVHSRKLYKSKRDENLSLEEQTEEYKKTLKDSQEKIKEKISEFEKLNKDIESLNKDLDSKKQELKELIELEKKSSQMQTTLERLKIQVSTIENIIKDKSTSQIEVEKELKTLKSNLALYLPSAHLIDVGFYEEPRYIYETSERYKAELQILRDKQKEMILNNKAIIIPESITLVEDST